jgi:nucleoside 2-deoxyribosyltransferase
MSKEVRFYLNGGGLFTVQGRWWDEKIESLFAEVGARIYNPWRESKEGTLRPTLSGAELREHIFESDRRGVDVSQGIIMLGEGAAGEVSSGTAWETGYGYARDKLVLCMRTDLRGGLNPLLKQCLFDGKVCKEQDELRLHTARAVEKIRRSGVTQTSYDPPPRHSRIRKVLLSAPYFTEAEEKYARELVNDLSKLGLDILFPPGEANVSKRFSSGRGDVWSDLFERKIRCLGECDAVVALLEGADCGSETSWDCGYGYSKYKPVFGMRTDLRSLGDLGGQVNLMMEQSIVGPKLCSSLAELKRLIAA